MEAKPKTRRGAWFVYIAVILAGMAPVIWGLSKKILPGWTWGFVAVGVVSLIACVAGWATNREP